MCGDGDKDKPEIEVTPEMIEAANAAIVDLPESPSVVALATGIYRAMHRVSKCSCLSQQCDLGELDGAGVKGNQPS
tara:strand:+ start:4346 stop:4573 length:228 start_codon:yes stop_codon:yes gene_type:complete